ncbi:MAG: right-handed parallel beta-helix repeat-containing protein [Phaeodactylibacter sp.]|nr:right-handed parallel beta-helix repeat-containing protein [Phaeodactylibacter sp.]
MDHSSNPGNSQFNILIQRNPMMKLLLFIATRPGTALLILALSLFSCEKAVGGTYYVDPEIGNDSYDGLSATYEGGNTGPWRSISKVNQEYFLPGDSILFKRGGVWTDGPLEPRNGGTPGGVITIEDTVIDQPIKFDLVDPKNNNCIYFGAYGQKRQKPRFDCQGRKGIVILHNYIIVEGLHIDNGANNMLWLGRDNGTSWVIINDVDVTNCSANAVRSSYGGGNIWLKRLYVYNYGVNGILLNGSANNKLKAVLVEDCWIENPEVLELEDAITCHRDSDENDLSGNIIIRNNTTLRAGEDGVDITSGSNILVEGNVTKYSQAGGIYVNYEWVNSVEVRGNFIYGNSISQGYGDLTIRSPRVRVINNIVAGTGHHSVLVGDTDNTQFWNNVIAPINRTGNMIWLREGIGRVEFKNNIFDFSRANQDISGDFTDGMVFDNNCYYGTSSGQEVHGGKSFQEMRDENPQFEPHGLWSEPRFLHPALDKPEHFKIALNSPCLNAGANLPVKTDFWGTSRPQDSKMDIGAHEVVTKAPDNPGWVSGRAWHDENGNCIKDANEPGIAKLIVDLYGPDGKFVAMEYSGRDGSYRFDGLPPGSYRLMASPLNFAPGRSLERMKPACNQDEKDGSLSVTIDAGKPASGQGLGFSTQTAPAVQLAQFTAEKNEKRVYLRWATSLEKNMDYFEIERSDDGDEFFPIGQAKSEGDTDGNNQSYSFTDEEPPGRLTYYRLKQVEKSGRYSYSEWKLANIEEQKGVIKVFPNPFSDALNLSLEQGATMDKLWVISLDGKRVFEKRIREVVQTLQLDLSALPKGSYYLIVRSDRERRIRTAFPIVKQ